MGEHEVRARAIEELPHIIHATEVQVVGIEADGTLVFHAYDEPWRCPPGTRGAEFELTYYFLSYGNRLRRTIRIRVHEVQRVAREAVSLEDKPTPWGPAELGRWLGVETE